MADIFISYASNDREQAQALAGAFEEEGWSVWWDRTILPGKTFDKAIEQALDDAKAVVVLWSSSSVQSDWVKEEIAEAARKGVLVPAMIENVTIPLGYKRFQAADLSEWDTDTHDPEFQNLVKAVGEITTQSPKATEADKRPDAQKTRSPKKQKKEKPWRTEIVSKKMTHFSVKIFLTNQTHTLIWKYKGLLPGGNVSLDGNKVSESSSNNKEEHFFNISDGKNIYQAELIVSGFVFTNFTLKIDGKILLSGA